MSLKKVCYTGDILSIFNKRSYKVYCKTRRKDGQCSQGGISLPKEMVDKIVYVILQEEIKKLREELKEVYALKVLRLFFNVVLNQEKGKKMFSIVTETWNPITGCYHDCIYCWARQLALNKLRNASRYRKGFVYRLNREEFSKRFNGGVIFVSDMGDMFGSWVKSEHITKVLHHISKFPNTYFLFLTKNPARYHEFLDVIPKNAILGTTLETNRDDIILEGANGRPISKAPPPSERYKAMKSLDWPLKFVSIEPILDFDINVMVSWIKHISPFMMYVGYDNYGHKLPEPPLRKTTELIAKLEEITLVLRKTIRPAWYETLEASFGREPHEL